MRARLSGEFEGLDATEDMASYEVSEIMWRQHMRTPWWLREGLEEGRLRRARGGLRAVFRRLAYRTGTPSYIAIRDVASGEVVRLPFH